MSVNMRIIQLVFVLVFLNIGNVSAKELRLAVGLALPPYVLSDTDTGMELDIVQTVFENLGHTVKPVYVPFARVVKHLDQGKVDGAITINENSGIQNVFYTDSHITYQNVAVSLKSNNYKIDTISDLEKYRILAFQNATKYLGDEFAKMASDNPKYKETAKQKAQIPMLFLDRTQSLVLDINIFKYFRKNNTDHDVSAPVTIHEIFPKTHYRTALVNEKLRDDFNLELAKLRASGKYKKIISNYVD